MLTEQDNHLTNGEQAAKILKLLFHCRGIRNSIMLNSNFPKGVDLRGNAFRGSGTKCDSQE